MLMFWGFWDVFYLMIWFSGICIFNKDSYLPESFCTGIFIYRNFNSIDNNVDFGKYATDVKWKLVAHPNSKKKTTNIFLN